MGRRTFVLGFLAVVACGGKGARSTPERRADIDADPLSLLPSSPIVVFNVNARAMFDDAALGTPMAALGNSLLPLGDGAGFDVSRDLDHVVVAAYTTTGADVSAVLSGRFDEARIASTTTAKSGREVIRGAYAGRATYMVGPVGYSVLSSKTVVAGTSNGLRRVLERVQAGAFERSLPPWMVSTLETKGADAALGADFATQPLTAAALSNLSLPWLNGMQTARVISNFGPPGMNFAATLTYGDAQQAQLATEGMHRAEGWLKVIGPLIGGIRLQNLESTTDGNDARCRFSLDDHALVALLTLLPRFLPTRP